MKTSYSSAPWTPTKDINGNYTVIKSGNGDTQHTIANTSLDHLKVAYNLYGEVEASKRVGEIEAANARLISAAPEMFELLFELAQVQYMNDNKVAARNCMRRHQEIVNKVMLAPSEKKFEPKPFITADEARKITNVPSVDGILFNAIGCIDGYIRNAANDKRSSVEVINDFGVDTQELAQHYADQGFKVIRDPARISWDLKISW